MCALVKARGTQQKLLMSRRTYLQNLERGEHVAKSKNVYAVHRAMEAVWGDSPFTTLPLSSDTCLNTKPRCPGIFVYNVQVFRPIFAHGRKRSWDENEAENPQQRLNSGRQTDRRASAIANTPHQQRQPKMLHNWCTKYANTIRTKKNNTCFALWWEIFVRRSYWNILEVCAISKASSVKLAKLYSRTKSKK